MSGSCDEWGQNSLGADRKNDITQGIRKIKLCYLVHIYINIYTIHYYIDYLNFISFHYVTLYVLLNGKNMYKK